MGMNFANQLTLARLLAVAPVMIVLYLPFPGARAVAVALYVAAIATDYFDGIFARRSKQVTGFGKLMDSIADKALIVSLFFALVDEGSMAVWMAAIMVIREFAVTGLRMVALEAGEVIAANRWGKAKMNAQSLAILILLIGMPNGDGWRLVMSDIGWWVMLVATVLTIISGWSYLRDTPRILSITSQRDQRL